MAVSYQLTSDIPVIMCVINLFVVNVRSLPIINFLDRTPGKSTFHSHIKAPSIQTDEQ